MKKLNQSEADSMELGMDLEKHFDLFMLEEPYVLSWKYYDIQHTQWKLTPKVIYGKVIILQRYFIHYFTIR